VFFGFPVFVYVLFDVFVFCSFFLLGPRLANWGPHWSSFGPHSGIIYGFDVGPQDRKVEPFWAPSGPTYGPQSPEMGSILSTRLSTRNRVKRIILAHFETMEAEKLKELIAFSVCVAGLFELYYTIVKRTAKKHSNMSPKATKSSLRKTK
jgi:hypothetical protein